MFPRTFTLKNGQSLIIREAEKVDAKTLLNFINYVAGETDFLTFGENEFFMKGSELAEFIHKCEKTANMLMLVGDVKGELAGSLSFRGGERQRIEHTGEFAITVARKYWGQGIGTRLIETLIAWAKESGIIRKINLRVHENNRRAIKLYYRLGFVKEGFISREYLIDGKLYGNVFMGLSLDN